MGKGTEVAVKGDEERKDTKRKKGGHVMWVMNLSFGERVRGRSG